MKELLIERLYFDPMCYTIWIGPLHVAATLIGLILVGPIALARRHSYGRYARTAIEFNLFLFIAGTLMNTLWGAFVWSKIYWCCDYVVDYSPFFPITPRVLRQGWMPGYIKYGLTLFHVNVLWALYAMLAWGMAITASASVYARRSRRQTGLVHQSKSEPNIGAQGTLASSRS